MRILAVLAIIASVYAMTAESAPLPAVKQNPIAGTKLAAATTQTIAVQYNLKEAGLVSAAVYDSRGRMMRCLLYGEKQDAGQHNLSWDGLDRYGQPMAPGEYEWRVLRTPGFKREFLVNVGANITWAPVDYWPGNHAGPTSLMVDEQGDLYVGSVSSEGPPAMIKITQDGKKLLHLVWPFVGRPSKCTGQEWIFQER